MYCVSVIRQMLASNKEQKTLTSDVHSGGQQANVSEPVSKRYDINNLTM